MSNQLAIVIKQKQHPSNLLFSPIDDGSTQNFCPKKIQSLFCPFDQVAMLVERNSANSHSRLESTTMQAGQKSTTLVRR
jgi:hypothetical protein